MKNREEDAPTREQLMQYKSRVTPKEINPEKLISYLLDTVDVEEITLEELWLNQHPYFVKDLILNATGSIKNEKKQLSADEFDFAVFRVLDTNKNKKYIDYLSRSFDSEFGYVVIERNMGNIQSNIKILAMELDFQLGVSLYDYENETIWLMHYLYLLYALENKQY